MLTNCSHLYSLIQNKHRKPNAKSKTTDQQKKKKKNIPNEKTKQIAWAWYQRCCNKSLFTALHGMQTRSSNENSVRPSVRPSVKHVDFEKTEERSVQILIPYERSFTLVFWEEEWLVRCDPFYLKFWVNRPPFKRNSRFLTDIRS